MIELSKELKAQCEMQEKESHTIEEEKKSAREEVEALVCFHFNVENESSHSPSPEGNY